MRGVKLKFLVTLLGIALLASTAWGYGINITCTRAIDHNAPAGPLNRSSAVQWIEGAPGLPDPAGGPSLLHSGRLNETYTVHVGEGTGVNGSFVINGDAVRTTSYLRVWENGEPERGRYYFTTPGYATAHPMPNTVTIAELQTIYLADAPPRPTVTAGGYNLTWDAARGSYLVAFSLTAHRNPNPNVEVGSYQIRVRRDAADWAAARTHDGGSWNITEDPADPFFVAGQWYVAQAQAANFFGGSDWGPDYRFQIPAGAGGVAEPLRVEYDLVRPADRLAVNSFPYPFGSVTDPGAIANVDELIRAINNAAAGNVVTTVGWWNAAEHQPDGYIITYSSDVVNNFGPVTRIGSARDNPIDEAMVRDRSYQVSVLNGVAFTFTGAR